MSDIKFRLGLDGKDFDKGLADSKKKATAWGESMDDISRKVNRTFGAGDVFKGLLQGVGIGSVEKVVDVITSGFRAAAEHAKDLASWTEKSLDALQKLIRNRRTDEQNLAALQRDQRRDQRNLTNAKNDLAFSVGQNPEAQKLIAETTTKLQERAVEIDDLQRKIDKDAKQRAKDLADAQEKLGEAKKAAAREVMTDTQKLVSLDVERSKAGLDSLNSKTTELERVKAATKEAELQKDIAALRKKISEDEARIAAKAAEDQKKRREEAEKLNEALTKALNKETDARKSLRDARAEQFAFTLADASQGIRGGVGGKRSARLFNQKTNQLNQILDRSGFQVAFGDDGKPTLTTRDSNQRDSARQATGRFRAIFNDREGLRGSINNLAASDRNPVADNVKAVETATLGVKEVLLDIRKAKFANQ